MSTRKSRTYRWRNAVERLQDIRGAIDRLEVQLYAEEWAVSKRKSEIARLERARVKVCDGLVKRA